jgi:hypothetical protein
MIAAGFIVLTIAIAALLVWGVKAVASMAFGDSAQQKKVVVRAVLVLGVWLGVITVLSLAGFYNSTALPPRVPLFLVFPAFAFTGFFFLSGKNKQLIAAVPPSWPVYFQSFRIVVELLLLGLALKGLIPKEASFEGYNFDVAIGLTAPVVGWLAFSKKVIGKGVLRLWNIAGFCTLAIVVFIFISHAYFPQVWHKQESIISQGFGLFPYTYLAGFLMPAAVFMHVLSLKKL